MYTQLSIASHNSHGLGPGRMEYIAKCFEANDILLLQEHWLLDDNIKVFEDRVNNAHVHGVSGITDTELLSGRPYGGVAILWKMNLKAKVTPLSFSSRKVCGVTITLNDLDILLFNVYMPCDTYTDQDNMAEYTSILD